MERIAFYAPMKPPDHPIASGDREIARLTMAALTSAGSAVELASSFISYQKRPSQEVFEARRRQGAAQARAVLAALESRPAGQMPQLWLTYHPYCKSPDWIGPAVSRALGIPYATVEACRTRQNTDADWMPGRLAVQQAIRHASANFCLKASDRDYLSTVLGGDSTIVPLAPFIDIGKVAAKAGTAGAIEFANDDPVILAVGMIRPGKKTKSYQLLAEALRRIAAKRWNLVIVGDGPDLDLVRQELSFLDAARVRFAGALAHGDVMELMRQSDIFAWPGYRESIGMVYLEAQANGLPVVALRSLGVPLVVADGVSGMLVEEGDATGYADAVARLLDDPGLSREFGQGGHRYVRAHHGIEAASRTFRSTFDRLGGRS